MSSDFITTADHERLGYLRCNTLRHAWFDIDSDWKPTFGTPLTVRCERCGMERRDTINARGDVAARHYKKPPHWKYPKGTRPTAAEFRSMLIAVRIQEAKEQRKRARA
jgi:hypothetical protein